MPCRGRRRGLDGQRTLAVLPSHGEIQDMITPLAVIGVLASQVQMSIHSMLPQFLQVHSSTPSLTWRT